MKNMAVVNHHGTVAQDAEGKVWVINAPEYSLWVHVPDFDEEVLPPLRSEEVNLRSAKVDHVFFPGPKATVAVRWGSAEAFSYGFVGRCAVEAARHFLHHGLAHSDFQYSSVKEGMMLNDTVAPTVVNDMTNY